MKYKLFRKDFEIWRDEIFFLPTVKIVINNMIYAEQNFSIEFHFLVFHARLLFFKKEEGEINGE